jgi:hypothetical protein
MLSTNIDVPWFYFALNFTIKYRSDCNFLLLPSIWSIHWVLYRITTINCCFTPALITRRNRRSCPLWLLALKQSEYSSAGLSAASWFSSYLTYRPRANHDQVSLTSLQTVSRRWLEQWALDGNKCSSSSSSPPHGGWGGGKCMPLAFPSACLSSDSVLTGTANLYYVIQFPDLLRIIIIMFCGSEICNLGFAAMVKCLWFLFI